MDLHDLQQTVAEFNQLHGFSLSPSSRLLDISSEVGEIAKEFLVTSRYGSMELQLTNELEEEIGDLFYSLLSLADETGVDMQKALNSALEKYEDRIDSKGTMGSGK